MSHGSVREIFGWEEMCDIELPIPSIEEQREIVREYNIIVNRIKLNEQLNQKLEETAQAIYKHWFVDFEFPISAEYAASIGKPELEGKPYKSNGGEMVFCEELAKEAPKDWSYVRLDEMADLNAGGDKPKVFSEVKTQECQIPIFANGTIGEGLFGFTNVAKVNEPCVTTSARGGIGYTVLRHEPFVPIVRLIVAKPKKDIFLNYLFQTIKSFQYQDGTSSAQSQLTVPDISAYKLLKPKSDTLTYYQTLTGKIFRAAKVQQLSLKMVGSLSETLNAKMARAA